MDKTLERIEELIDIIEEYPPAGNCDTVEDEEDWSDAISELKILLEDLKENYFKKGV